ncbi:hypothetical protein BT96DRAFT_773435, partial [Gymnopus androsaceus JB14]
KIGSPCTNHPLTRPLCPADSPAIWKYNLVQHLSLSHHGAMPELYENLYQLNAAE